MSGGRVHLETIQVSEMRAAAGLDEVVAAGMEKYGQ